jgi:hypothetical protein
MQRSTDNEKRESLLILSRIGAALREATAHVASVEQPPHIQRLLAELGRLGADGKPPGCPDGQSD